MAQSLQTNPSQAPVAQVAQNVPPPVADKPLKTPQAIQTQAEKTLYNTSYHSLFFRNFISGAGKALGAIVIYLIFVAISGWLFKTYVLPEIQPFISTFETLGKLQSQPQTDQQSPPVIDPAIFNQILQQLPQNPQ